VRPTHSVLVKQALLKELDQTFQRVFRQTLAEVVTELKIRNTMKQSASTPESIFTAIRQSRILESKSSGAVTQMRHALERMSIGKFGICARCGRKIPASQLERDPLLETCASCRKSHMSN
jgi:DnaK suppressor protein